MLPHAEAQGARSGGALQPRGAAQRRVKTVGGDDQAGFDVSGIGLDVDDVAAGTCGDDGASPDLPSGGGGHLAQCLHQRRATDPDTRAPAEARLEDGPVLLQVPDAAKRRASIVGHPHAEPLQILRPARHQSLAAGLVGDPFAPFEHERSKSAAGRSDRRGEPRRPSAGDHHVVHQRRIRARSERAASRAT